MVLFGKEVRGMEYLYVGKIVNTHGIKGEVRVLSDFPYKDRVFKKGFCIYIGKNKEKEMITSYRVHKMFDMITMEGFININEVLKYKGKGVFIRKDDLVLGDNEYLEEDLIGLDVIVNQEIVGRVVRIERDKYQSKIVVNKGEKEYLVPYVCDIIKKIDLDEGRMEIQYIKGLLD